MYAQGLSIGKAARVISRNRRGCVKNSRYSLVHARESFQAVNRRENYYLS